MSDTATGFGAAETSTAAPMLGLETGEFVREIDEALERLELGSEPLDSAPLTDEVMELDTDTGVSAKGLFDTDEIDQAFANVSAALDRLEARGTSSSYEQEHEAVKAARMHADAISGRIGLLAQEALQLAAERAAPALLETTGKWRIVESGKHDVQVASSSVASMTWDVKPVPEVGSDRAFLRGALVGGAVAMVAMLLALAAAIVFGRGAIVSALQPDPRVAPIGAPFSAPVAGGPALTGKAEPAVAVAEPKAAAPRVEAKPQPMPAAKPAKVAAPAAPAPRKPVEGPAPKTEPVKVVATTRSEGTEHPEATKGEVTDPELTKDETVTPEAPAAEELELEAEGEGDAAEAEADPAEEILFPGELDGAFEREFGSAGETAAAPATGGEASTPKATVFVPPAIPQLPENLTETEILQAVMLHRPEIVTCVEKHKGGEQASGSISMRWTIHPEGNVSGVNVATPGMEDSPLGACLKEAIAGWTFPRHKVQQPEIQFPFKY